MMSENLDTAKIACQPMDRLWMAIFELDDYSHQRRGEPHSTQEIIGVAFPNQQSTRLMELDYRPVIDPDTKQAVSWPCLDIQDRHQDAIVRQRYDVNGASVIYCSPKNVQTISIDSRVVEMAEHIEDMLSRIRANQPDSTWWLDTNTVAHEADGEYDGEA
jgi:hypothetical protein